MKCEHASQHNEGVEPDDFSSEGKPRFFADHLHCSKCKKPWLELEAEFRWERVGSKNSTRTKEDYIKKYIDFETGLAETARKLRRLKDKEIK